MLKLRHGAARPQVVARRARVLNTGCPLPSQFKSGRYNVGAPAAAASSLALSSCDDNEENQASYQSQLLKKMSAFMGPALLIPLADPLMSLVDTVCIGQCAGTLELAAMGPANTIFSFATFVWQNLQVATLTQIALHTKDNHVEAAQRTLATALLMALTFGLLTTVLLELAAPQLIAGTGVTDASLLSLAIEYMRVRAWAQPAVLVTMVAQSGMLAQQDSLTPCISVMVATLVSLVGNLVFVAGLGWGLPGAGMTTVATQYVGAGALMWALHRPKSKIIPHWSFPRWSELASLLHTMGPLTIVSLSKHLCYLLVQTTAASLTTMFLAAHQACFSLWSLATWTVTPIEQACMAYLPGAKAFWQRQAIGKLVLLMGTGVGALAGFILWLLLTTYPGMLVKDALVQPHIISVAFQAGISVILVGVDVSSSAINLSNRDFAYVARSYIITLLASAAYFSVCRSQGWGLGGVWLGLTGFFGIRAVQSTARALWHMNFLPKALRAPVSSDASPTSPPGQTTPATSKTSSQEEINHSSLPSSSFSSSSSSSPLSPPSKTSSSAPPLALSNSPQTPSTSSASSPAQGQHHKRQGTSFPAEDFPQQDRQPVSSQPILNDPEGVTGVQGNGHQSTWESLQNQEQRDSTFHSHPFNGGNGKSYRKERGSQRPPGEEGAGDGGGHERDWVGTKSKAPALSSMSEEEREQTEVQATASAAPHMP